MSSLNSKIWVVWDSIWGAFDFCAARVLSWARRVRLGACSICIARVLAIANALEVSIVRVLLFVFGSEALPALSMPRLSHGAARAHCDLCAHSVRVRCVGTCRGRDISPLLAGVAFRRSGYTVVQRQGRSLRWR